MKIVWSANAWAEYLFWQENDKSLLKRVNALIKDIQRTPFEGIGKPEKLKHEQSGYWSSLNFYILAWLQKFSMPLIWFFPLAKSVEWLIRS